ncbi:MAG: hypothetical protein CME26_05720 [Gemmatimonadetes bacterium]|nr:hypothetical protein [Gemmatimonadota bacterium]
MPAKTALLNVPLGISVDTFGNIFVAETGGHRIRRIDGLTGNITTVAGNGTPGAQGDGGPATAAQLSRPQGVSVHSSGDLYIADSGNRVIRRVDAATGLIETFVGSGQLGEVPADILIPRELASFSEIVDVWTTESTVFIADGAIPGGGGNNIIIQARLGDSDVSRIAGTGNEEFSGDGSAAIDAGLSVEQMATTLDFFVFADFLNHRVRQLKVIVPEGDSIEVSVISTIAGRGLTLGDVLSGFTFSGDGGPATDARLQNPSGIAADETGNVYIADTQNHRVRAIEFDGSIVTLAGTGVFASDGDGELGFLTPVENPARLALDPNGDLLIVEPVSGKIRKLIDPTFRTAFMEIGREEIDFGAASLGVGKTDTLLVQNFGNSALNVLSVSIDNDRFTIPLELPAEVRPNEIFRVPILFQPEVQDQVIGNLVLETDDPFRPSVPIEVRGTGIVPDADLVPLSGTFVRTFTDASRTLTFRLSNVDEGLLLLREVALSDTTNFSVSFGDSIVATGDVLMISVTFQPTLDGEFAATMTIRTNDPDEPLFTVALSGTGQVGKPGGFLDVSTAMGVDDGGAAFGVAWADYDRDGDSDLYVVRSLQTNLLYRNDGGRFTERGSISGVNDGGDGSGAAWADYDHDGDLDLYVTNFSQPNRLYRQESNSSFTEVATAARVDNDGDGYGAAWADFDNDNDNDLYVANFGSNVFYRNEGSTFTEIASQLGVADSSSGVQPVFSDFDNDGDLDLFLANSGPNRYWVNEGGTFVDSTSIFSPADDGPSFGAAVGDYDNDGLIDLYVPYFGESNRLYQNQGGQFADVGFALSVNDPGLSRGAVWADFNNDGWHDIFVTNSGEPNRVYRSDGPVGGNVTFAEVAEEFGTDTIADSRGVALSDFDGDGGLDLFVAIQGGPDKLFQNQEADGNWVVVSPIGTVSSSDAIGTRIELVYNQTSRLIREITGGTSFLSQDALCAAFGIGDAFTIDTLTVRWPSGILQRTDGINVPVNALFPIVEESPPPPVSVRLTSTTPALVANGVAETEITATAIDAVGDVSLISDRNARFSLDFLNGQILAPTIVRLRDGRATVRYRAGNIPATVTVTAAVDALPAQSIEIRLERGVRNADTSIETVAGTGNAGFNGDGGPATEADLQLPRAVAIDSTGTIYVADSGNNRLRVVDPTGTITLFAGTGSGGGAGSDGTDGPALDAPIANPLGLALLPDGSVLVSEFGNQKVRRIESEGSRIIRNFAGRGVAAFGGDGGPATLANLQSPAGITIDTVGNVYIAEQFNFRVRRVDTDGLINTIAGSFGVGFSGDGFPATAASLDQPTGVAIDTAGAVYVADQANHRIRRIGPDGIIATFAGTGENGFSGDGGPAIFAQLSNPRDVIIDRGNRLYVSDSGNDRVRVIDLATRVIQSVAGSGSTGNSGSQGIALTFGLNDPRGLAVAPDSTILIADAGNNRILRLRVNYAGESPRVEPPPGGTVTGDFTGDDRVTFEDFLLFAPAFGSSSQDFDLNGDGSVGFADFLLFVEAFSADLNGGNVSTPFHTIHR